MTTVQLEIEESMLTEVERATRSLTTICSIPTEIALMPPDDFAHALKKN